MITFNNTASTKDQVLALAKAAIDGNKLRAWANHYRPDSGEGSPFAALLGGEVTNELESKFGIPLELASIFESIFVGHAKHRLENEAMVSYIDDEAAAQFVDFLEALPIGASLKNVPAEFLIDLLEEISKEGTFDVPLSADVKALAQRLRAAYMLALAGTAPTSKEMAEIRRGGIKFTDESQSYSQSMVALLLETVAWQPLESSEEIINVISRFIFQAGSQAFVDAQTDEERAATAAFEAASEKLMRDLGRTATPEEVRALAEYPAMAKISQPARQMELGVAAAAANARYSTLLQKVLSRTILRISK